MKMTSTEIAKIIGSSVSYVKSIGRYISKGKKSHCSYHCDDNYFENIIEYKQAYWLGFLMADGCIYKRKNEKSQKWIRICLQKQDINHLIKFKNCINSNHPIKTIKRKSDNREYVAITIVSNKMADDLSKYGCVERKTGVIKIPKLNNEYLIWGFIHGYIDGDGSIVISYTNRYQVSLCGNKEIIQDIESFIYQQLKFHGNIRQDNREYSFPFYNVTWEGHKKLDSIFKHTYLRNIIYLDRKYERVQKYYIEKY